MSDKTEEMREVLRDLVKWHDDRNYFREKSAHTAIVNRARALLNYEKSFDAYWDRVKDTDGEPTMWDAMIKLYGWEKFETADDFRKRARMFSFREGAIDEWINSFYLAKFPNAQAVHSENKKDHDAWVERHQAS